MTTGPGCWECGPVTAAEGPGRDHYRWHQHRRELPCPKSLAEAAWWNAEQNRGRPLPLWRLRPLHQCGTADQAAAPSEAHYGWHRYHRTTPCPKSRAEAAWQRAEKHAQRPLPDWPETYQPRDGIYLCGPAGTARRPGVGHYQQHHRRGEAACPAALAERAMAEAARDGRGDGYQYAPHKVVYECGPAALADVASEGHYQWHRRRREPACGRALAEKRRYQNSR